MSVRILAASGVLLAFLTAHGPALAQSPAQQPLVQLGNLRYLGTFAVPLTDGTGRPIADGGFTYGGSALGVGAGGTSLYFGCHDWGKRLARVSIPAIGGAATVLEPCAPIANLAAINPAGGNPVLGGSLAWNGRLTVSAFTYYDGSGTAVASHFVGTTVSNQAGPHQVAASNPGFVGGYMGEVPLEWRASLGGPALTGQCCLSIIGRTSLGPTASVFNPDDLGVVSPVPSTMLVGYPITHPTLGAWNSVNPTFTGATAMAGLAFPAGTRSVLFFGRHGATFCYGSGTSNQALHGTADGQGGVYCYDPTSNAKGSHGYPYHHQVWAYDANDLLAVKQGTKQPWDLQPYGVWTLPEMDSTGSASIRSAAYDPTTRRVYVTTDTGTAPAVHVYEVTNAVLRAPGSGPVGFAVQRTASGTALVWSPPLTQGVTAYRLDVGSVPGGSDVAQLSLAATTTGFPLPGGVSGTYYARIVALYADGTSAASTEVQVVLGGGGTARPSAPTGLRASMSGTSLVLNWDPPADASVSTVVVDAGTTNGGTDVAVAIPLGKYGPYVVPAAPAGTFYLRLRAVSPAGTSDPSNEVAAVVGGSGGGGSTAPPSPPGDLQGTVGPGRTVTLMWQANERGPAATGFVLEGGSQPGTTDLGSVTVQTSGVTTGPVPAGVYYIRVRARNSAGIGAPSSEIRLVVP